MSVANILDPSTGQIKGEYLPSSAIIENEVAPFNVPTAATCPAGTTWVDVPGTTITVRPGDILNITSFWFMSSTAAAVGSDMKLIITEVGSTPPPSALSYIVRTPESTTQQYGTFNFYYKNESNATSIKLQVGSDSSTPHAGDISVNLFSLFMSKVIP